jgi:hypothetical protein
MIVTPALARYMLAYLVGCNDHYHTSHHFHFSSLIFLILFHFYITSTPFPAAFLFLLQT